MGLLDTKGLGFRASIALATSDPRNVEHLLKTKFNADDETWQRQRKTASIEFHSTKFRKLTTESLFELVHKRLIPVLESSVKKSIAIDLQDVLLRLTFDNVCMIAFGVDPGCSQPHLPEIEFAKAFEDATEATAIRFVSPVCDKKKELSLQHDEEGNNKEKLDLLTVFMRLKDENGKAYSDKFLRDICVNFILAGRDTSSVALSWFFWLIDQNPEVEEKILAEICRVARGDKEDGLLHAALSEALRLYPSVPVDHKEVVEDDMFPDGTLLKKGTKVIYAIYSMGRMESIWGKDCREFKPERWLRDGHFMSESAYKFTAFNGGPRFCLGKDFAYYQMKYAAASIIYRYHVKVVKDHPVVPKLALTLYMKHGLKVNLHRRHVAEIQKHFKFS
ncbi:Cytochrome P450 [Sesbania bispinosa]|nr:Cytochrome P450 [Sesbania bispinosa]